MRGTLLPAALAAVLLAACENRRRMHAPAGVRMDDAGTLPANLLAAPGQRSVAFLALDVIGLAAVTDVSTLGLQVQCSAGGPAPLVRVRVVLDRDADSRFVPETDLVLATLQLLSDGRSARGPLGRRVLASQHERWLVVADVLPQAAGARVWLALAPGGVTAADEQGRTLATAGAGAPQGPQVQVQDQGLAGGAWLAGGGARGALRLPPALRPARVLAAGNPATGLREEAPGLFTFLLPRTVAGPVELKVLGALGEVLATIPAGAVNRSAGPARFTDRSLDLLPRDHAFGQDAEVADVDGDGAPDLLVPCYAGQRDRLYHNDGDGRFQDVTATHMPDVQADTVHIEPADVDGDGDVDLVLGVEGGQNRLYLNDGTGKFTDVTGDPGRMPRDREFTEDVQAGDLDGDGDLDLVFANLVDPDDRGRGGQIRVYVNDGAGRFADETAARVPVVPTRTYDVNLGDLDGDGDLDLLAAGYGERNLLYENLGAGRFVDRSDRLPGGASFHTSAVLGDVDGDGDLDVVVGTFLGASALYLNQGQLAFADGSANLLPEAMSTYDVALADLDGDGDLDLLFANTRNPSILALNDGAGRFTAAPPGAFSTPDDNAYDVQVLDADGDGALDVLITTWGEGQDTLYLSRASRPAPGVLGLLRVEPNWGPPGGGTWLTLRGSGFADGMTAEVGGTPLLELAVRDERTLEGRLPPGTAGPADVVLRSPGGAVLTVPAAFAYQPLPPGAFEDVTAETLGAEPAPSTAVAAGDLDGDGLPDLVFADQTLGARVRVNTGGGRMRVGAFPPVALSANDVALADLDRDGHLDLVLVDAAGPPRLFAGNGDGTLRAAVVLAEPASGAEKVAVGDLDGDGDLDLVFAVPGPEVVLRNDGAFGFARVDQPFSGFDMSRSVALGDLDGDGDLDLVVANFMGPARLYRNDGTGRFAEAALAIPAFPQDQSYGVALADVDGDRDLDVAIANGGAQANRLLLNDGTARCDEAPQGVFRAALGGGSDVVFGDVDGDGDPDLFGTHFWGNNHLYHNQGGRFAEQAGMLPNSPGGFASAAFADLDGDGDLDLILAAFWGGSRILRNPTRR